ncbi:MAG: L,D-transpeptidase family protein [Patescibacteria group bacterium]
MKSPARRLLSWVFGIISVFSLLLAGAGSLALAYQGKITPNTVVGGVEVGGLTPEKAIELIKSQSNTLNSQKVTLKIDGQTKSASYNELGVEIRPGDSDIFSAPGSSTFGWLAPAYWRNFFQQKSYPIAYQVNKEKFLKAVESKFHLRNTAKNASVKTVNGHLVVIPAISGKQVHIDPALTGINQQLTGIGTEELTFTYEETAAEISTATATQTKTEITKSLQPVSLVGDGRYFTISLADEYELIDYSPAKGQLHWQVSEEKLRSYLNERIAFQLNIPMVQKIIQRTPKAVLQQGRDGRAVVIPTLLASVYQNITEPTPGGIIEIPLQTVTFTELLVEADYIPGLFEGIYVDINLAKQKMTIVDGKKALRSFIISSGQAGLPTPKGVFYIKNKISLAQSRLYPGIWMRYWNALAKNPDGSGYEGYGIHDLPCFNSSCTLIEGAAHLGSPVSHGCVRLGHENAIWFYANIPIKTPVNIH